jgi:hypothetical protein
LNDEALVVPRRNSAFCPVCGEGTMETCAECEAPIRGRYHQPGLVAPPLIRPASYCHECGQPYPWTVERLLAAAELIDELEGLNDEERDILSRSLVELLNDSPQSELAAHRTKRLLRKAGGEAREVLRDLLVEALSETTRRLLLS